MIAFHMPSVSFNFVFFFSSFCVLFFTFLFLKSSNTAFPLVFIGVFPE